LVQINGRDVQLPDDACVEGEAIGEFLRLPPEMGGSNTVLRVRRGDAITGVTVISYVTNPDPRFDFLREALK
jgi:hypothetical protein